MSKVAKQIATAIFLTLRKYTGFRVRKIKKFTEQDELKTIAIFSTTALGDFILNTPAIRAIKNRWPTARLVLVMNKRNYGLIEGSPYFDEIVFWNGKVNGVTRLASTLRQQHIDATFILHSRPPYDILAANLARSPIILKDVYLTDYQGRKRFMLADFLSAHYDKRSDGDIHLIQQKTRLLESVGIPASSYEMFIPAPFTAEKNECPVIGIHAGASSPERRWPAERFAQLATQILERYPSVNLEFIGAPAERELNQQIIDAIPHYSSRVKNMAGKTDLKQLTAKIAGFTALVVGDTGPLHIAVAVKTPVIGLFENATYTTRAAPLQDRNMHHIIAGCDEGSGIQGISVRDVYTAASQCLNEHNVPVA
ncbi:glycosyltransferase family 9 protein [Enterobacteriaceae bacterium 89]|nr:glycosyltransferase family 9 protein [Enterobacteriaceae bacterium 89]